MRKLSCVVLFLLFMLPASPGQAGGLGEASDGEELELIALELESLYVQLTGAEPARPRISKLGDQRFAMTVDLPAERAVEAGARSFRVLAVGHQISTPTNPRYLANPAIVSTRAPLNFWWAVNNGGTEDKTAATRLRVKGAGRTFLAQSEDVDYPANSLTIYWQGTNQPLEKAGIYTVITKVAGAGGRKTSFIAD